MRQVLKSEFVAGDASPERIAQHKAARVNIDEEAAFGFDELFFSRTNASGIIASGNSVFQRVSGYAWDELIDKPHNVIRHPDMPRGVFWTLWDYLKRGEPIGAYVKNRSKDGRYYWVYAIVTPVDGGYLSVRLKPSALLPTVKAEYEALLALERQQDLRARDSAKILLERLNRLGFESYDAFMATTLRKEMAARDAQLRTAGDPVDARFDELTKAAASMIERVDDIYATYRSNALVPLNLKIRAAQLGQAGAPLAAISSNYNVISLEIKDNLDRFYASAKEVLRTIDKGTFQIGVARLQREVAEFFRKEASGAHGRFQEEMGLLERQQAAYSDLAVKGLQGIADRVERFADDCAGMKHLASGLEVTRVMGKMESARLSRADDGLDGLMDDLQTFQATIADGLKEVGGFNHRIGDSARHIGRMVGSIGSPGGLRAAA
jgi:aerotaxis receptor